MRLCPVTKSHRVDWTATALTISLLLAITGCDRGKNGDAPTLEAALSVKEHTGPLDRPVTAAGEITVIDVKSKDDIDMVTQALSLAGKTIYDQNDRYLSIERAFDYPDKRTVLLLAVSEGGTACPSQYLFLTISADGSISSTDTFGTCSDLPTVTVSSDKIMVSLPNMRGLGIEAWAYTHGGLTKTQSIDPNVERNAPRLAFTEDEPIQVRGTLIREPGASQDWSLRLPMPTKLDGGAYSSCPYIVNSLQIHLPEGASIPKADGENDFVATISCFGSGGSMITAIQLSSASQREQIATVGNDSRGATSSVPSQDAISPASPLTGEWTCQSKKSNGTAYSSAFKFDGSGGFAYVDPQSQLIGTYQPNGVNATVAVEQAVVGGRSTASQMKIEIGLVSSGPGHIKFDMTLVRLGTVIANDCVSRAVAAATPAPQVNICDVNPAACAAIQRNSDIRSQVLDQRCEILRSQLSGVTGSDYQLAKAGCQ